MNRRATVAAALAAGASFLPATAHAHLIGGRLGDFYGGLLHPLMSLEHVLPWLALCLLAGLQRPEVARWVFLAFPLGIIAGIGAAMLLPQYPIVSAVNVASFIVLGALVAAALQLPAMVLAGLAFAFGASHGFSNGESIVSDTNRLLFTAGVATAGYLLVTIITALVTRFRTGGLGWRTIALRAAGSWIAAVGIMVLGAREFIG